MSKDLMLIVASAMPEEMIVEQLQEALTAHKIAPTEKTKSRLGMYCMMFASKEMTDKFGIEDMMKKTEQVNKIYDRLNDLNKS